jgi:hypothetical protein
MKWRIEKMNAGHRRIVKISRPDPRTMWEERAANQRTGLQYWFHVPVPGKALLVLTIIAILVSLADSFLRPFRPDIAALVPPGNLA